MTILHGVVHGTTIELAEPADLPKGSQVRVVLVEGAANNGSAGGAQRFARPAGMELARAAFLRDLPALLADKESAGKWFLYRGQRCVKAAKSQRELVRHCQRHGWNPDACYIDMAIPHPPEPEAADRSFLETAE
jgi:hypothetical protein